MSMSERKTIDLEQGWGLMLKGILKLKNILEGLPEPPFSSEDYMMLYTTVYKMCTQKPPHNYSQQLYDRYRESCEDFIVSTVLPSLQGKKDELLLGELVKRWAVYKVMTRWLLRFFHVLDRYYIPSHNLPSLEETSFLSFYELVHNKINKQVEDAILAMIDQEHAGVQIDRTLVNNALAVCSEIGDIPSKNYAKHLKEIVIQQLAAFHLDEPSDWIEEKLTPSSKKIRLVSSDGDVFEVDYNMALMSKTIEDAIKTKPAGGSNSILVSTVSSKILAKIIEYCKKHSEASNPNYKEDMSGVDIKDWDAEFVGVDNHTLFDLHLCANYLNIKSLLHLTSTTIGDMIKGKGPEEVHKMF